MDSKLNLPIQLVNNCIATSNGILPSFYKALWKHLCPNI